MNYALNRRYFEKTGSLPVSNSNGAIPNINTMKILEKKANWRPKMTTPILLITHLSLCLYAPWNAGVRRTKRSKGTSPEPPLPPSGSQKGGGLATRDYGGYWTCSDEFFTYPLLEKLHFHVALEEVRVTELLSY